MSLLASSTRKRSGKAAEVTEGDPSASAKPVAHGGSKKAGIPASREELPLQGDVVAFYGTTRLQIVRNSLG